MFAKLYNFFCVNVILNFVHEHYYFLKAALYSFDTSSDNLWLCACAACQYIVCEHMKALVNSVCSVFTLTTAKFSNDYTHI